MIADFHFLRPLWLIALIPLFIAGFLIWRKKQKLQSWQDVCDAHLLNELVQHKGGQNKRTLLILLISSGFFFIISLAGPAWKRIPLPAFKPIEPRVIVLNLSEDMLDTDLTPNRLDRAKFELQDLFQKKNNGQWGMIVYTGEPFVVSPLTEDGSTIAALLPSLSPDIMPIGGDNLDSALMEAAKLITQAGFHYGTILVMTATPPSINSIKAAKKMATKQIYTSVLPTIKGNSFNPLFRQLAQAGNGQLIKIRADSKDLQQWLNSAPEKNEFTLSQFNNIPLWQDEGRWFLIPALLLFLPVFRRGSLQGITA